MNPSLNLTVIAGLSVLLSFGCAKKREASLPEDQVNNTFALSELQSTNIKVKTIEGKRASTKNQALLSSEKNSLVVDTKDIPSRFLFMFRNLELPGEKSTELNVIFGVDRSYVTAYKVSNLKELSTLEQAIALAQENLKSKIDLQKMKIDVKILEKNTTAQVQNKKITRDEDRKQNLVLVPLFKFKIQSHGIIEKVKNEVKEETSVLKLKKAEWEQTTHVQISDISHERLDVEIDPSVAAEADTYLVTDKINKKSFSKAQLSELLATPLDIDDTINYVLEVNLNSVQIFTEKDQELEDKKALLTLPSEQVSPAFALEKGIETNLIKFTKSTGESLTPFTKLTKTPAVKAN